MTEELWASLKKSWFQFLLSSIQGCIQNSAATDKHTLNLGEQKEK